MAEKLRRGMPTDIVILTGGLVAKLAEEQLVDPATIADVGMVETALAVRAGDPQVAAKEGTALRKALLASDAIFVPDIKASTAGIHVAKVLAQLGIAEEVVSRLSIHPNGATAMKYLAASAAKRPIGCTQTTEILNTAGVVLSGSLPSGYDLATMYTGGVTTQASHPTQARILIDLLTGNDQEELRRRAGFVTR